MFYLLTVVFVSTVIIFLNFILGGDYQLSALAELSLLTVIGIACVFSIDGILAFLIRRLPEKWFSPEARIFSVGAFERKLYRRSKIGVLTKYVPEWGCFTGFHKDKMRDSHDSEYIGRFLIESNYGVAGHLAGAVFSFAILLIPALRPLTVALPIALTNALLSILPTMILRSNTPALRGLYKRNKKRDESPKNSD